MRQLSPNLCRFIEDTRRAIAGAKARHSVEQLRQMISRAPKLNSLFLSLKEGAFGLIAEIKERSPSQGSMSKENVLAAPEVYRASPVVRGISVLTNQTFFGEGMTLERLRSIKELTQKPVLRKDFVIDAYQVYEARAYGADAVLLMANILERSEMEELFGVATDLGMDVLFETHTPEEIESVPAGAKIYGINCRNFDQSRSRYWVSRWVGQLTRSRWLGGRRRDLSIDFGRFAYGDRIPAGAMKIAESGVSPENTRHIRGSGFDAILVGTSLLLGPEPIRTVLSRFEKEILAKSPN